MQFNSINEIPHLDVEIVCTDSGDAHDSVLHPILISLMLLGAMIV